MTERADQLNKVDFASLALSVFSGKQEEIVLPDLPLQEDFERQVLFLGEWAEDEDDNSEIDFVVPPELEKDGVFESEVFADLLNGNAVSLDLSSFPDGERLAFLYDSIYGLALSFAFKDRTSVCGLDIGKLEIALDGESFVFKHLEFIGDVLFGAILPLIEGKFLSPSPVFAKMYAILNDEIAFFLPLSNIFLVQIEEDGISTYDSFVNYNTYWGGLLGWYRLEYAVRSFLKSDFRFDFTEAQRRDLRDIVIDKIIKIMWLYQAIEDLLNENGKRRFESMVQFYLDMYEVQQLSDSEIA